MSPASASASDLPNVSRPVATVRQRSGRDRPPRPASPTRSVPRSIAPVTTVPRPLIVSTFSIGIRNGSPSSAVGHRHVAVDRVEQVHDGLRPPRVALERPQRADTRTTGTSSPGKPYSVSRLADLQLDQVEQLRVVGRVGLVERHHQVRHADPLGEQHVLAGLRHRTVLRRDDEDRAVHLRRPRDHVLHVVGVPGHVDVGVVPGRGLVLDVGDVDGDARGRPPPAPGRSRRRRRTGWLPGRGRRGPW